MRNAWILVASALASFALHCAPESRTSHDAAEPSTRQQGTLPDAAPRERPPLVDAFPTNAWNQRHFQKFRHVEAVDPDWAPRIEEALREKLRGWDAPDRKLMLVECRSQTCAIGLVAWRPGNPAGVSPPWPKLEWAGAKGARVEVRPDGWLEQVRVLRRHPLDQPRLLDGTRVDSLASPASNPACTGSLPGVGQRENECRALLRDVVESLCFDSSKHACACVCSMLGVDPPSCLREAGGKGVRCTTRVKNQLNDVFLGGGSN
jgi:hypothetical protein